MMHTLSSEPFWSPSRKIFFRFLGVYLVLYTFPFPMSALIGNGFLNQWLWDAVVPWAGRHLLGIDYAITVRPNGSGDTTYNYVQVFILLIVAFLATLVWTLADRRPRRYDRWAFWLRVYLRYYLGIVMLGYGFAKVFKTQFPFPHLLRLLEPYGDSSPMGLAWTFMGYSTAYNLFTGGAEVLGGLLLFWRRTTTLGALVLIGVLGNVVMMNFSYDIPVKLFSSHLLLVAFFLAAPDAGRLWRLLVGNTATAPADLSSPVTDVRWRRGLMVVKALFLLLVVGMTISQSASARRKWGDKRPKPPLYGIYEVESFVRNGDTIPPLLTDPYRWRYLVVDWEGYASVKKMDNKVSQYAFQPDTSAHTIVCYSFQDTVNKVTLHYDLPDTGELLISGPFFIDSVQVRARLVPRDSFLLVNRGFHWVNEYPFNR